MGSSTISSGINKRFPRCEKLYNEPKWNFLFVRLSLSESAAFQRLRLWHVGCRMFWRHHQEQTALRTFILVSGGNPAIIHAWPALPIIHLSLSISGRLLWSDNVARVTRVIYFITSRNEIRNSNNNDSGVCSRQLDLNQFS